jgi:hypothetical protein
MDVCSRFAYVESVFGIKAASDFRLDCVTEYSGLYRTQRQEFCAVFQKGLLLVYQPTLSSPLRTVKGYIGGSENTDIRGSPPSFLESGAAGFIEGHERSSSSDEKIDELLSPRETSTPISTVFTCAAYNTSVTSLNHKHSAPVIHLLSLSLFTNHVKGSQ